MPFSKWRAIFWPIHAYELKKLLPMLFMFFCIVFNYTLLRDIKDALIVTSAGAEAVPFLKSLGVVPTAIIIMIIYTKLSNVLSRELLFYITLLPFIIFFGLFAWVIYPAREFLMPTTSVEILKSYLPDGWSGLALAYQYWIYSVFFIFAELWGNVALSLLFWGFANQITKVSEAKRFYNLFGLGGNVSLLFSGPTVIFISDIRKTVPEGVDAWQISLNYLMGLVIVVSMVLFITYRWINRYILTDTRFYDPQQETSLGKKKTKMSIIESLKFVITSKYILCIAVMSITYGIASNLMDITWLNQVRQQYPHCNDYSAFMGFFTTLTGITTIIMMFAGGHLIRHKGWKFAALTTPFTLLVTGSGFFFIMIFKNDLSHFIISLGTTPLFLTVMFGAIQEMIIKSSKYSIFDPTKEMAYIPLDDESKVKGKAVVDVVGTRLGKAGGSLIQMGLFTLGTLATITPYIAVIFFVMIGLWIIATHSLSKQFLKLTSAQESLFTTRET